MASVTHPNSIALPDGSMWVANIGPDRQLRADNPGLNAVATVNIQRDGTTRRQSMRESDFVTMAESGTPEQKKFANQALSELHNYERNVPGGAADPQILRYERPQIAEVSVTSPGPAPVSAPIPSPQ